MRTVGEIIKNKRVERKITLEEVESAVKIRTCYLEAIESNNFSKISGGVPIVKGFIKNYSEFLGLPSPELLAVFRRDFLENKSGQIIPRGVVEPLNSHKFHWTPNMTLVSGLVALFLTLGGFLFYEYSSFIFPPRLEVFSPRNGEVINQSSIVVKGKTDPDSSLYLSKELRMVAKDGSFDNGIQLVVGENNILVESVNRRGQKSAITLKVYFNP